MNSTYERIPVADLKIERYNRTIRIADAQRIAAFFNESLLGTVAVSYRDGNYTIIDGQHRVMACRLIKKPDIMCQVFRGLTYEEEARLFVELNKGKNRRPLEAYYYVRGLYEAGDPLVRQIYKLVEELGLEMSVQKGDNKIVCASTVHRIADKQGIVSLKETLTVIVSAWGGSQESLKGFIIEGVAHMFKVYDKEIDNARLIEKLRTVMPERILAKADVDPNGGPKKTKVARQILSYYNKNLSPSKKLKDRF